LLYVAASDPDEPYIWAFHLGTAHKDPKGPQLVNSKQVFFNAAPLVAKGLKGLPDGLKVDQQGGNLWLGGPGGIVIISPAGKHLGTIRTGEATANCAWGDDGSTLYFTADMYLCRIKTLAKGKIPG
jgi:gluconolactonase